MRLSAEHNTGAAVSTTRTAGDPALPDLAFLASDPAAALQSFFRTIDRVLGDNPVATPRLLELAAKTRAGGLDAQEAQELDTLKLQALRQGRAVGAVIGFFLKLKPYPMLDEIRQSGKLFQPAFGPVVVLALYWKRMTGRGAFAGMLAGAATVILWKEGCNDGAASWWLDTGLYEMVPGVIAATLAIVAGSLLGPRPSPAMEGLFEHVHGELRRDGL